MSMSVGGEGDFNSEINVTPMVDIMLVLMIIFMVVTPMLQQGVSVNLPRDLENPEDDPAIIKESSVVIALPEDEQVYIGKEQITKEELGARVKRLMDPKPENEKIVYVKSGTNVKYGFVVDVINVIRKQSIDKIGLVADKKKKAAGATAPAQ